MSIDWKTVKPENVKTLCHFATEALLKPKARKNILKNTTEDQIIHLLDTVNQPIRRHLLNILIEQSDDCPVSIQVGINLLKNRDNHFWIYHNYHEILCQIQ